MSIIKLTVAQNILELRKNAGMTQAELAEKLNYTDRAVSKWERGESLPDIEGLKKIADFFGITVDELISEKDEKSPLANDPRSVKRRHTVVTILAVLLVFLLATIGFFVTNIATDGSVEWLCFIYALPVSFIVLLVFNSIWFEKRFNYLIISLLMWTIILSVFLSLIIIGGITLPLLLVLGIPGQIIILVWSYMRKRPIKRKK